MNRFEALDAALYAAIRKTPGQHLRELSQGEVYAVAVRVSGEQGAGMSIRRRLIAILDRGLVEYERGADGFNRWRVVPMDENSVVSP